MDDQDPWGAQYEPKPHERSWYRHVTTGQRGYYVRAVDEGTGKLRDCIQLDRPSQVIRVPFTTEWMKEEESRPFNVAQAAMVAYGADVQLCLMIGEHGKVGEAKNGVATGWASLSDEQRRQWMVRGPKNPRIRAELYAAVMNTLKPLVS